MRMTSLPSLHSLMRRVTRFSSSPRSFAPAISSPTSSCGEGREEGREGESRSHGLVAWGQRVAGGGVIQCVHALGGTGGQGEVCNQHGRCYCCCKGSLQLPTPPLPSSCQLLSPLPPPLPLPPACANIAATPTLKVPPPAPAARACYAGKQAGADPLCWSDVQWHTPGPQQWPSCPRLMVGGKCGDAAWCVEGGVEGRVQLIPAWMPLPCTLHVCIALFKCHSIRTAVQGRGHGRTRLAQQNGVVLCAPCQNLHHTSHLTVTTNHLPAAEAGG